MRVPADLFRPPRHLPFGLLTWLCDGAPVAPESWTSRAERWLAHRVFAMECVRNFDSWLTLCLAATKDSPQRWSRVAAGAYGVTYWGVIGNDSQTDPLRVFIEVPHPTSARYWTGAGAEEASGLPFSTM